MFVLMFGFGGDYIDVCDGIGERIWVMEEGVGRWVYGGVLDFVGGEDKEYGWEMVL